MNAVRTPTARQLKALLDECSPLIEGYTRRVCPSCTDPCCKQMHGIFTASDRAYLAALDEHVPVHDLSRAPGGPCQFLGPDGCSKPRWQRAWKCTWYFCGPLLRALDEGPPRKARALSALLARIGPLYDELERA
jgi:hypothetical protein